MLVVDLLGNAIRDDLELVNVTGELCFKAADSN
ncbi:hypothetical protein ABH926_004362 [Catenulispora sp. GP43]